jgi:hypothetical protein
VALAELRRLCRLSGIDPAILLADAKRRAGRARVEDIGSGDVQQG